MIRYSGFGDLVDHMVASAPDRPALLHCGNDGTIQTVTWAVFAGRIESRAEELESQGSACEAILADGTIESVAEVFAAVRAGLQVALVDPMVPNRMLEPLLKAVDADCVWASNKARCEELGELLSPSASPAHGAGALLFFTSGTTSSSKPVVLTDASLMASAFNGASLMPLTPDDTLLCLLPLSHVFGFVCGLLWGLSCGATVALGRGPRHYLDDPAVFKPTTVSVVPKLLELLVARNALNEELKLVLVGAADCPDELLGVVRQRGIRASLGYGLTETSSGVALSTGDDFHAMTICPDDTVNIDATGEILITAPTCLMQGYYRDPDKTAATVIDGVLHTGDRGFLDEQGRLHVQGRLKDVVVLPGGTKVFLPEYETAMQNALGESDVIVMLLQNKLTLVCGKLTRKRTDREIMVTLEPALAAFPPGNRIAQVMQIGHALPRTAAGDVERWKVQEEIEHDDR